MAKLSTLTLLFAAVAGAHVFTHTSSPSSSQVRVGTPVVSTQLSGKSNTNNDDITSSSSSPLERRNFLATAVLSTAAMLPILTPSLAYASGVPSQGNTPPSL